MREGKNINLIAMSANSLISSNQVKCLRKDKMGLAIGYSLTSGSINGISTERASRLRHLLIFIWLI